MILDERLRLIILKGKKIDLTERETQILSILIERKEWVDLSKVANLDKGNISIIVCRLNKKILPYYRIVNNYKSEYCLKN